jgi:hypothetical protein
MPNDTNLTLEKWDKHVLLSVRRIAEEAIPEGRIVKRGTGDYQVKLAGANEACYGVSLNTVDAANIAEYAVTGNIALIEVEVAVIGIVPVLASEVVTAPEFCVAAALGLAAGAPVDGTGHAVGRFLRDGAANETTHILLAPQLISD